MQDLRCGAGSEAGLASDLGELGKTIADAVRRLAHGEVRDMMCDDLCYCKGELEPKFRLTRFSRPSINFAPIGLLFTPWLSGRRLEAHQIRAGRRFPLSQRGGPRPTSTP